MPIQAKSHAESKSSTKWSVRGRRLELSIGLAGPGPGRPYTLPHAGSGPGPLGHDGSAPDGPGRALWSQPGPPGPGLRACQCRHLETPESLDMVYTWYILGIMIYF
jgi:hypothetical protein